MYPCFWSKEKRQGFNMEQFPHHLAGDMNVYVKVTEITDLLSDL